MPFAWDEPVKVKKRVQEEGKATQIVDAEATPREIVFQPFNYRMEDVLNAVTITARETILTIEAQAKSADLAQRIRTAVARSGGE